MKVIKTIAIVIFFIALVVPRSDAQYLPENSTYWWMQTDDGVMHYILEMGNNPEPASTIIVLHGGYGAEHSYLIEMLLPLSKKYRFILYDQRGSLRSEAPDSTITFDNFVRDLDHLRQQLGLNKINLLAHSNGSNIALDYLGSKPDFVHSVVLVSPPLSFLHSDAFSVSLADLIESYRIEAEAYQVKVAAEIEEKIKQMNLQESDNLNDRDLTIKRRIEYAGWHTTSTDNWPHVRNAFFNQTVFKNLSENVDPQTWRNRTLRKSEAFVNAEVPIRVIIGDSDFVDPKAIVWSGIIQYAKNGTLKVLEEAGHNAWIDKPEAFQEALNLFLEAIPN